jgi:hypothetical protein
MYLNGELGEDEEIYMQEPPGYKEGKGQVKQLQKSLYGLKQARCKWYDALTQALTDLCLCITQADLGIFHMEIGEHILIMGVHVDNCIITGSSADLIAEYKCKLHNKYALTDLGPIHWLLGIKIVHDHSAWTISLSQSSYIDSILAHFNLTNAKAQSTPMVPNSIYSKEDSPTDASHATCMKKMPYREAIGSLMYTSIATCPDITFTISTLSQFLENLGEAHWDVVKHIFHYLAGTKDLQLTYGGEQHDLIGYMDADGASQPHRHAISGHTFLIDSGAVSWSSRKQELVMLSTAKAEYIVAMHAAKEVIWLCCLIRELFPNSLLPTTLFCDNQATLKLAIDDNYHARTKHIDIQYHFICQVIKSNDITIIYCPTDDMTADILTKALPSWKVTHHTMGLGLQHATFALVGE